MIFTADEMLNTHGILLRRCQQVALAIFTEEAIQFDVTPTQYSALAFIYNEPGIQQNVLGDRIALDRSSVTKCVEGLETRGLIRRQVDQKDKRARMMYITPDGEAMLKDVSAAARRARHRIERKLGGSGFSNFIDGLKAFSSILDETGTSNAVDLQPPRA